MYRFVGTFIFLISNISSLEAGRILVALESAEEKVNTLENGPIPVVCSFRRDAYCLNLQHDKDFPIYY